MSESTLTEPQRLWIEALRSGIFKQTTHVLCRLDEKGEPVGFCCLGVACELARVAGVQLDVEVGSYSYAFDDDIAARRYTDDTDDSTLVALPDAVRKWLGVRSDSGAFFEGADRRSLAGHNDAGEPFERIADIIESKPAGLFVEGPS